MTETIFKLQVNRNDMYQALIEFSKLCDNQQAHHAIRVSSDGKVYVTTDAGWCCSEDEYYNRMPHTVTIRHAAGAGQCDLPEDWSDEDGDLLEEVDRAIESLTEAGYDVEEIES